MAFWRRKKASGQTSTEYMLVLSVIVVALAAAAYVYLPGFQSGTQQLSSDVSSILATNTIKGGGGIGAGSGSGVPGGVGNGGAGQGSSGGSGSSASGGSGSGGSGADGGPGVSGGSGSASMGGGGGSGTAAGGGTYSQSSTTLGGLITTTKTADQAGTGGTGADTAGADAVTSIAGAQKTSNGAVAATAADAPKTVKNGTICGPAVVAAITGQSVKQTLENLKNGNYLTKVHSETKVMGVTVSSSTSTPGVMTASDIASYLQQERGWNVNYHSGGTMSDITNALANNQKVIVRIDVSKNLDGTKGHFGMVRAVDPNKGVLLDSSTGTAWIPMDQFQQRWNKVGNDTITGTPPQQNQRPWWFAFNWGGGGY